MFLNQEERWAVELEGERKRESHAREETDAEESDELVTVERYMAL